MNSLLKIIAVVVFGWFVCQLCVCASSGLFDKWHDPAYQAPPLGRILVIAVRKESGKRQVWENAFAGDLIKHGVAATTSYSLFPEVPPDTDQVISLTKASNFDGILVVLRLPTETDMQYVKGSISIEPDMPYGTSSVPFWKRYWTNYLIVKHPGYVDSQTVVVRTIEVITTGNNSRLIWRATSRTPDPGSVIGLQKGVADIVIEDLKKQHIIGYPK